MTVPIICATTSEPNAADVEAPPAIPVAPSVHQRRPAWTGDAHASALHLVHGSHTFFGHPGSSS